MPRGLAILVTAAVAALVTAGCSSDTDDTRAGLIAPESYRPQIRAVEVVLYQSMPAGPGDIERAGAALRDLHAAVVERESSPRVRSAANELLFLSARADASGAGYAIQDLRAARDLWERSRDELFGEADWFLTDPSQ